MSLRQFKIKINRDSLKIPDFIDTKHDYHIYSILSNNIFTSIALCAVKSFKSYMDIQDIAEDIFISLSEIKETSEGELYVIVYKYVINTIKNYEKLCTELEFYECSQNYSRLIEILTGKRNILNG